MESKGSPWWGVDWWIWALGCLAVAVVYLVIDTEGAGSAASGWRNWVLRWGHGLCWILLAVSFVTRMGPWARSANLVAAAGGLVYLAFLALKLTSKHAG